jgi:hypothetical protein
MRSFRLRLGLGPVLVLLSTALIVQCDPAQTPSSCPGGDVCIDAGTNDSGTSACQDDMDCEGGFECNDGVCEDAGLCGGLDCNDGIACTDDLCIDGLCANPELRD